MKTTPETQYRAGDVVLCRGTVRFATDPTDMFVHVRFPGGSEMLEREAVVEVVSKGWKPKDRVTTRLGTAATVVYVDEDAVFIRFDEGGHDISLAIDLEPLVEAREPSAAVAADVPEETEIKF